ncbi:uncharacterized protein LOC114912132 [Scleropages formosus]|uniref:uncharacterized protein LOC114912132 n=1 Tax=Scleropages formosus TaxID=113540 RepID=UPI0010FABCE8|nr:uncharacterized protein LOC114912132 [Scleropages formosus]
MYNITLADDIVQPNVMMKALLGDSVTLTCFCTKDEITYIAWFEQPFGQKPQIVAKALFYSQDVEFQAEFENRLSLQWIEATKSFNMTILKTELSDSAVYYCVTVLYNEVTFGDGTILILTGNSRTVVQQVVSDPVRPGDSVTLQCTVDSETCAGEHSVYWFRHGSGESLPGLIYTHGNRSDECERSPEAGSHTHSCIYSLPKRNLSPSDAGIYYCAVATCGDILFGNGTVVKFPDEQSQDGMFKEERSGRQCQDEDMLNYAALNVKNPKPKRKKRETKQDTIYSDLRVPDWE